MTFSYGVVGVVPQDSAEADFDAVSYVLFQVYISRSNGKWATLTTSRLVHGAALAMTLWLCACISMLAFSSCCHDFACIYLIIFSSCFHDPSHCLLELSINYVGHGLCV